MAYTYISYQIGLYGCGPHAAFAIAQLNLGTGLVDAFLRSEDEDEFSVYLHGFRNQLHDILANNPNNILPRKFPLAAASLTEAWPRRDILALYARPILNPAGRPSRVTESEPKIPCFYIRELISDGRDLFRWSAREMFYYFEQKLLYGIVLRALYDHGKSDEPLVPLSLAIKRPQVWAHSRV